MENAHVGMSQIIFLILGLIVFITIPVLIAILWKIKKKEPITSILIGAATFMIFAIILEKPIQNVLLFPTTLGFSEHVLSKFMNANPLLLALLAGLFPGIFEETGRFVAYKTVLKKRKNKDTSISYGIGHGCFEVIFILGVTYLTYIIYAIMINTGSFNTIIEQVVTQAPDQMESIETIVNLIGNFSFADLSVAIIERVFAVLFHIGASIFVFYACNDKKKFYLYPISIILHTIMDFIAAMSLFGIISISPWMLELIVGIIGTITFLFAYFLLYKKDKRNLQI